MTILLADLEAKIRQNLLDKVLQSNKRLTHNNAALEQQDAGVVKASASDSLPRDNEHAPKQSSTILGQESIKLEVVNTPINPGARSSPNQRSTTVSADDQALYDWIIGLRVEQLPEVPFNLYQGVRVTGGEVFLKSLQQQAARGVNEARARNGVLQDDIRQLKKIIESKIT